MAQFNANKPYKIMKRTLLGVVSFEVHQPQGATSPGGPVQVYEAVTNNPGNINPGNPKLSFPTEQVAHAFALNKKSEGDGLELVFDSEA